MRKKYALCLIMIGTMAGVLCTACKCQGSSMVQTEGEKETIESELENEEECYLCGLNNRSLMGYYRKFDDLGVISLNQWYVLDFQVRNHDEDGNLTEYGGNSSMGFVGTGEGGDVFRTERNSDRGISEITVEPGKDSAFDVKKIQPVLCQDCLDRVMEAMEIYEEEGEQKEPWDICLVDFQTLEVYPLQEHNLSYFIRDYYVRLNHKEEELEVEAIYAPVLENGRKSGE